MTARRRLDCGGTRRMRAPGCIGVDFSLDYRVVFL